MVLMRENTFGIDLGSQDTKVSMAQPNSGVHVLMNQNSKRLTPTNFAIWKTEDPKHKQEKHWDINEIDKLSWSYFYSAKSHSMRFPESSIQGTFPLASNEIGITKREYLALLLRQLIKTIDEGKYSPDDSSVVFAVDPATPLHERLAILEAAKIANISVSSIIDSSTAVAQTYALEKRSLFANGRETVMFVDIGAKQSWFGIFTFQDNDGKIKVEEHTVISDSELGGEIIDEKIAEKVMKKYQEKMKIKNISDKLKKQFLDEAKRAKEVLSIDNKAVIRLDDDEFEYTLTKSELEEICVILNNKIKILFMKALKQANIEGVDSIELIGGATRMEIIQNTLKSISGLTKLNRTLNSEEAVALGAGYIAAKANPSMKVKDIEFVPKNHHQITINDHPSFDGNNKLTDIETFRANPFVMNKFVIQSEGFVLGTYHIYGRGVEVTFDEFGIPLVKEAQRTNPDWMLSEEEIFNSIAFIRRMEKVAYKRMKIHEIKNNLESTIYKLKSKVEEDKTLRNRDEYMNIVQSTLEWLEQPHTNKEIKNKYIEIKKIAYQPLESARINRELKKLQQIMNMVDFSLNKTWPSTRPWLRKDQTQKLRDIYQDTFEWYQKAKENQTEEQITIKQITSKANILKREYEDVSMITNNI